VVVDAEGSKKTNKTTLRSEWRGVRKKCAKKKKKAVERKKKGLDRASIVIALGKAWKGRNRR